jgi:hypothetical protein
MLNQVVNEKVKVTFDTKARLLSLAGCFYYELLVFGPVTGYLIY